MAIKFASSSLSSPESNLYSIEKFNGVDYTTTPTLVDDSRAIDISNYLPKGNSLVKRNGATNVAKLMYKGCEYTIHNIWESPDKNTNLNYETEHFVFASYNGTDPRILWVTDLLDVDRCEVYGGYEFGTYDYDESPKLNVEDLYSYGVYFEGKLFVLCMSEYLVIGGGVGIAKVRDFAYVPTIVTGLGKVDSETTVSKLEEFNLLSNKCKIEILVDTVSETEIDEYDIGKFFAEEQTIQLVSTSETTGIGTVTFDATKKKISLNKKLSEENKEQLLYITLEFSFTQPNGKNINVVEKMRFGASYGSYGHRDRIFLSGNPDYPNLDIHSCETGDTKNPWMDYTYFGDLSYTTIGTSDSAITGYGFLNNGQMAIFKESKNNQPNLYFRRYEMVTKYNKVLNRDIYEEQFPVTISGLSLDIDVNNNVINYENDLLINTSKGVYKIMAGESTATQTYKSNEVSYFIRDNLGSKVDNSAFVVFDNKLYISREDNIGNKRVYVADYNRYGFVDGKQVYEWFVLDGLNVDKFFILNKELYFSNENGLFKFNDTFEDMNFIEIPDININDTAMSKEVFLNQKTNRTILASSNEEIQNILSSSDERQKWEQFKQTTKIRTSMMFIPRYNDVVNEDIEIDEDLKATIRVPVYDEDGKQFTDLGTPIILSNLLEIMKEYEENDPLVNYPQLIHKGVVYFPEGVEFNGEEYVIHCRKNAEEDPFKINTNYLILRLDAKNQRFRYDIDELYYYDELKDKSYPFSKCMLDDNNWYYVDGEEVVYLGQKGEIAFNEFTLKLYDCSIDFEFYPYTEYPESYWNIKEVLIEFYNPVKSYWRSKFTALGRLDYLKTIDRLTFVADSKRGGDTRVGFRTSYKTMSAPASLVYGEFEFINSNKNVGVLTMHKNNTVDTSMVRSSETSVIYKDLDFNDIDFSNFSFSTSNFAKTQTMKKKVKNFSFVQMIFESDKSVDSTIASFVFRYKYTKNNKGVK